VSEEGLRVCKACGSKLSGEGEVCPICVFRSAIGSESDSGEDLHAELEFEHYRVLRHEDGVPVELGRGAMGVTYKAFDLRLERTVALKIIQGRFIGDQAAQQRFLREARAAASVRNPNVASVFHLGKAGIDYFYAMEFVEGETLEKLIKRSGQLKPDVALEITRQIAAGLSAIRKQNLVHRDIKPGNIIVNLEEGRPETVKIIDLGLAKGIAEEGGVSTTGTFAGTPEYASPEQFVGVGVDIRSDLYSLGITFWEMLTGGVPFKGTSSELIYQHQHTPPPVRKLAHFPKPLIPLLELMLEKDPARRFQTPNRLLAAINTVSEALRTGGHLTRDELKSTGANVGPSKLTEHQSQGVSALASKNKPALRWLVVSVLGAVLLLGGWLLFYNHRNLTANQPTNQMAHPEKSIAVLPFESLSPNKDDTYFADGVQDEILNDLAKVAQLTVISRTSVMLYRADEKRDLRQIANALGVANVLEGTVRRNANRVRISIELVDALQDKTIWADSFDRDLTDIFAVQSEVAQTIATKLAATLSPEEKRNIEKKPTENLDAYDLYLRAKELINTGDLANILGDAKKPFEDAVHLLDQAVQLDPKFTLAYCRSAYAHDQLYLRSDRTPEQGALADAAVSRALALEPDLPEVHLIYAFNLYRVHRDYERVREQLSIARRGLPNDAEAIALEAYLDRRQGQWGRATQEFRDAITRDPRNSLYVEELALTFSSTRQYRAAEQMFDRLIGLNPDEPLLKAAKGAFVNYFETGDDSAVWTAIAAFPASMADDRRTLLMRLSLTLVDRDWVRAKELIKKINGGYDEDFAFAAAASVPVDCYSILLARLQGVETSANASFAGTREELNEKVQKDPGNAGLLSQLAVVDALLNNKETAISEAKHAAEMLPISKDALDGPLVALNQAVVYAWTGELDLAFETLNSLAKIPNGLYYGQLKGEPYWQPLRQDPRYEKLLAELAPKR
jgi:serine/threonine protein kinase/tetratricopeptide (TPR) repeat protein